MTSAPDLADDLRRGYLDRLGLADEPPSADAIQNADFEEQPDAG